MPDTVVTVASKLTLSLHITATRADGYHELDAMMVSLNEPHDVLVLTPARRMSLRISGPFARVVPADASNLAWLAAEACGVKLKISLHKEIPPGGGLGGGSADAAGVLVAMGGDPAIAPMLGADVAFCMQGGCARVRGIGEELEPAEIPAVWVVVATPPFGCSTAAVYRAWDELGGPRHEINDLQPAAEHLEPRLIEFRRAVEAAAGAPAILAGSGSSYAVLFNQALDAEEARARVAAAVPGSVRLAATSASGVIANRYELGR